MIQSQQELQDKIETMDGLESVVKSYPNVVVCGKERSLLGTCLVNQMLV